jgi:hypothetical protein
MTEFFIGSIRAAFSFQISIDGTVPVRFEYEGEYLFPGPEGFGFHDGGRR